VLYWLARRDYAQQELRIKLRQKKYTQEAIESVINELVVSNLINENQFTENYTHWRSQKGFGPVRIMQELQVRGISAEMIAEHVQITDNAWLNLAQRVWRKHFKSAPQNMQQRAKQMRFLQYRGFTREQIDYALGPCDDDDSERQN
jgi:regulatory protein